MYGGLLAVDIVRSALDPQESETSGWALVD